MALTNPQKAALAQLIIRGAADNLNAYEEDPASYPERSVLADVSQEDLYDQVGRWLYKLPGHGWDSRLPRP